MKWMQFFTPVKSMDYKEADEYIKSHSNDDFTLLDVRQPSEYEEGHIPGSLLIPMGQVGDRIDEIDAEKPVLVYCAVGGRSRVAAQMLAGKGFKQVINMSGGIKAWKSKIAVGPQHLGMDFFDGKSSVEEILKVAYSLEEGLRDFYLSMEKKASSPEVKKLFSTLAEIEVKHQASIFETYKELSGTDTTQAAFEKTVETKAMEGGLSTEEYLDLFKPDLNSQVDVISLAMSIEAQAMDLYQRVSASLEPGASKSAIDKIAEEEKAHLASLAKLMDSL